MPFQFMSVEGQHRYTLSGPDGRYCFKGLPAGEYVLKSGDRARLDGTAWTIDRPTGSRFLSTTGLGYDTDGMNNFPFKITEENGAYTHFDNADSGFLAARVDLRATQVLVDPYGAPGKVHKVGDVIEIYGLVSNIGNAAEHLGGTLTLPEGLTPVQTGGGMPSHIQGRQVIGDFPQRRFAGDGEWVGAWVRIDKAMTDAEIKVEVHRGVFKDINPDNNVATATITTVD